MELISVSTERKFIRVVAKFARQDVPVETAAYHAPTPAPSHSDVLVMGEELYLSTLRYQVKHLNKYVRMNQIHQNVFDLVLMISSYH
jgi:hypothetical protein